MAVKVILLAAAFSLVVLALWSIDVRFLWGGLCFVVAVLLETIWPTKR